MPEYLTLSDCERALLRRALGIDPWGCDDVFGPTTFAACYRNEYQIAAGGKQEPIVESLVKRGCMIRGELSECGRYRTYHATEKAFDHVRSPKKEDA